MAEDPYKYFRIESRELVESMGQGVLELEKGAPSNEVVGRLLRLAHTLKGASGVVKLTAIAAQAHAFEDLLSPYRQAQGRISQEGINQLLQVLDTIATNLKSLDPTADPTARAVARADEAFETVRVEIAEMDGLLEGVTEVTVLVNSLQRQTSAIERAELLAAVARELVQVRDAANRARLLPASSVLSSLERATRDAAQSLHREVSFVMSGGEIRLDGHVLAALRDALLHVVRNAVAHGLESESERVAAGKSTVGRIDLEVERRGNRVAFRCRDDGRGIDVESLRLVAARRGLLAMSESKSLDLKGVVQLLLKGGLSTSRTVTELSGRGIGLDVVRETAVRLKGEVTVESEIGRGTCVEICVPVSLSSLAALLVDAGGVSASVPLDAIRKTLRLADSEIARSSQADSIVYEGKVIPFVALARALHAEAPSARRPRSCSAVVVQSGAAFAAVGVDRLLGIENVIMRALPAATDVEPIVAGASLDAEGNPRLVLDPAGLVAAAHAGRGRLVEPEIVPARPILVVDDSLTTRMLEQSILESAGYEVEVATSAEEALAKAKDKRYAVFVVDVEMPGMSGYDFVARTRADPVQCEIPAILVTSRASVEDRQRGQDVGARAYIVKSEFDQEYLLRTIRELVAEKST